MRSLRPNFGFHLVLTSFHLEFSSFWISRLFDLGDLSVLQNGTRKHFENGLKSMQIFQRLMEGMNRRERSDLNQMYSAVRSGLSTFKSCIKLGCESVCGITFTITLKSVKQCILHLYFILDPMNFHEVTTSLR